MILLSNLRQWEAVPSSIVRCGQTFLRLQPEVLEFWVFCGWKGGGPMWDRFGTGLHHSFVSLVLTSDAILDFT